MPIRIGDIAKVSPSDAPVYTIVTANGKPAVLLSINRQPESNTLDVAREVHKQISELRAALPQACIWKHFTINRRLSSSRSRSVRDAVLIGIVLSAAILVLFLRDWGSSLVAALVIPVTLLFTFIILRFSGQSFNLMTWVDLQQRLGW